MTLVLYASERRLMYFEEGKFKIETTRADSVHAHLLNDDTNESICGIGFENISNTRRTVHKFCRLKGNVGLVGLGSLISYKGDLDPLLVKQTCFSLKGGESLKDFKLSYEEQALFKKKNNKYKNDIICNDRRTEYEKLIVTFSKPSIQKDDGYTEDLEASELEGDRFATVRVNVLLSSSMTTPRKIKLVNKYKKEIYSSVLNCISNDRHYKEYKVPVSNLKLDTFKLLNDGSLDILFVRRDA